jgi:predicted nucleotidyltransferase
MNDIYRINFKQLRQETLKDIFASFEKALAALQIDFYLIGALARDTWFASKGIRALGTKDVDFAVMVPNEDSYQSLKQFLVDKEEFIESSSNKYALFSKNGRQVDLLPFGAIEIEGRKIKDAAGMIRTDITGFTEVYEAAVVEVLFEDFAFKVSSIPGIVILKMIAYDDRPEIRSKDIRDIASILNHYFDLETDMIYENHIDLFDNNDMHSQLHIAARVLGREMQPILYRNALLKERIVNLLTINNSGNRDIALLAFPLFEFTGFLIEPTVEVIIEIFNEINKGIYDIIPK